MITHSAKIIWKSRKKSILLVLEFLLSFLSVIAISTIILSFMNNNNKEIGYSYDHVFKIEMNTTANINGDWDEVVRQQKQILKSIRTFTDVVNIGYWHYNYPFSKQQTQPGGPVEYQDKIIDGQEVDLFTADENMQEILDINIIEGRWFDRTDIIANMRPTIINSKTKDKLFPNGSPIGKIITICGNETKIIGVIDDFRYLGEFSSPTSLIINHQSYTDSVYYKSNMCMSCSGCGWDVFLLKTKSNDINFEQNLVSYLKTKYPEWVVDITSLDKLHDQYITRTWTPIILISIIVLFILSNVLFGLFGLLWYSITLRKAEIGLRMAVGADKSAIYKQFIYEMLALVTLGIIPGIIIAIQFPLLHVFDIPTMVFIKSLLISTALMYFLVGICALLPSAQAAKIQPATALHDE